MSPGADVRNIRSFCKADALEPSRPSGRNGGPARLPASVEPPMVDIFRICWTQVMAKRIARVEPLVGAVRAAAERSGLLHEKSGRIGGRVSPELVRRAKARTGIKTDTDLIAFALANLALEDRFAEAFAAMRGTVDPNLELGF